MDHTPIVYILFLIFCGAAVLATLALSLRQSLIIAYIALGLLIGPWGLNLISDLGLIRNIAHVGIVFLLFLLGLHLHPQQLIRMAGETVLVTGLSSLVILGVGYAYSPVAWQSWMFDHSTVSEFPLTGAHAQLSCAGCHQQDLATMLADGTNCASCHQHDDPHDGRFGGDCGSCHTTETF